MGEFLGRFHPLVVHLPIGILVLTGVAGLLLNDDNIARYRNLLRMAYLIGTLVAGVAILTGLYLAPLASYEEGNVWWHKWMGITTATIGLILFWHSKQLGSSFIFKLLNICMLLVMTITGHLGGMLTHGPGYLFTQAETGDSIHIQEVNDSTLLFEGLVFPVLQMKCIRCHQKDTKNGGLDMSSMEALMAGSDGGPVIEAGNADKSELFKRVSLPANHPKFMPPNGQGMTYDEVRILEWWLQMGALSEKKIGNLVRSPGMEEFLERQFGLRTKGNDPLAGVSVSAASPALLDSLTTLGLSITPISAEHNVLDVVLQKPNQPLTAGQLTALLALKEQIVWLNLAGTHLNDESLQIIGQLKNLRKLHLDRNAITDKGLINLEGLVHLEYLNLYGTGVSDAGMGSLDRLVKLKELFIGQTKVTTVGIHSLQLSNSELEIIGNIEAFIKLK